MGHKKLHAKKGFLKGLVLICLIFGLFETPAFAEYEKFRGDYVYFSLKDQDINPKEAYNSVLMLEKLAKDRRFATLSDQALFTKAKYKIYLGYVHDEVPYVKENPDAYIYNDALDAYIYKGDDLVTLVENYPESSLADDAAYMYATLPVEAFCPRDRYCDLEERINRYKYLFNNFNDSPYIYESIVELNTLFDYLIDMRTVTDALYQKKVTDLLDVYSYLVTSLENSNRLFALNAIENYYMKLGKPYKSNQIHSVLLENRDSIPRRKFLLINPD